MRTTLAFIFVFLAAAGLSSYSEEFIESKQQDEYQSEISMYESDIDVIETETETVISTTESEKITDDLNYQCEEKYEYNIETDEPVIVSVELPVINEYNESVFDFIIDPQQLITATNAACYNGMDFEDNSTLYFKNEDGLYDYSHNSDYLTVVNNSDVPVAITLIAELITESGILLSQDSEFCNDYESMLYLALEDNFGNIVSLDEFGMARIETQIEDKYGNYDDRYYCFRLSGASNPLADWENFNQEIYIYVTWIVTPILNESGISSEQNTNIIDEVFKTEDIATDNYQEDFSEINQ